MITRRRWTKEEEEILVQAVKANPHNLEKVFRETSVKLNRTPAALHHRWTNHLKNQSVCFITVSSKKKLNNGKVSRKGKERE